MNNYKVENGYLTMDICGGVINVPLAFIKVLTPVFNENLTKRNRKGEPLYTFHIYILPSFAGGHNIVINRAPVSGQLYCVLRPTPDINFAHKLHRELSEYHGFSEVL